MTPGHLSGYPIIVETNIYASTGLKGVLEKNVYEIPRWRDRPKARLRIWLARRRYRRSLA